MAHTNPTPVHQILLLSDQPRDIRTIFSKTGRQSKFNLFITASPGHGFVHMSNLFVVWMWTSTPQRQLHHVCKTILISLFAFTAIPNGSYRVCCQAPWCNMQPCQRIYCTQAGSQTQQLWDRNILFWEKRYHVNFLETSSILSTAPIVWVSFTNK